MSSTGACQVCSAARSVIARFPRSFGVLLGGTLALVTVVMVTRRFAGALTVPLSTGGLATFGLVLIALAVSLRLCLRALSQSESSQLLVSASVVLAASAAWLPGSPRLGLVLVGLIIAAEELWAWRHAWPFAGYDRRELTGFALPQPSAPAIAEEEPFADILSDPAVTQQLVRRTGEGGAETISGWVRVNFSAGERTAFQHVAFCPPLPVIPECYAEPMDGPPARVRVAQVLHQGVRLEVRLDDTTTAAEQVVIELSVVSENVS